MSRNMENLGDIIRTQRKLKGLTQDQLGEISGYSQGTTSAWERGEINQIRNWRKVADVLDIDHDTFERLMAEAIARNPDAKRVNPGVRKKMNERQNNTLDSNLARTQVAGPSILARQAPVGGLRDVPVYGRAQGGVDGAFEFNGEIMGYETRPPVLEGVRDAYAIYVDGLSMYPRYKSGETVWVNPNRPAKREDDVIVQVFSSEEHGPMLGFIKEFVAWTPTHLVVKQWNPEVEIRYDRKEVHSVHLIVYAQRG